MQAQRLREFTLQLESLTTRDTALRLAKYLLERCDAANVLQLDLSLTALAKLLGVSRENLSRTLSKMVQAKLLAYDSKQITILDAVKLKGLLG